MALAAGMVVLVDATRPVSGGGVRPKLLDLFCGAGGAAMGYHRAGFEVFGVDTDPAQLAQYPFDCKQADVLEVGVELIQGFDAVHASPPCQHWSRSTPESRRASHPQLIEPVRARLVEAGVPFVIENVPGSPVRGDFMLCGTMFGLTTSTGLTVQRHRYFECGGWVPDALGPCCQHLPGRTVSVVGNGTPSGNRTTVGRNVTVAEWREVMGMPWATRRGLAESIPPAYTEHIGRQLLEHLRSQWRGEQLSLVH